MWWGCSGIYLQSNTDPPRPLMLAVTPLFPLGSHLPLGVHPWALRSLKAPAVLSAPSPAWGRCWSHPSAPLLGGTEFRDCCAMGLEDAAPLHGLSPMAPWGPPVLFWAQFPLQRCQARRTSFFCLAASPTDRGTNVMRLGGRRVPGAGPLAAAPSPP